MVSGKLCCGVNRLGLLVRIGPEVRKRLLERRHVRPMKLAGRTVSSFVRVDPEAYRTDASLAKWVEMGVRYALVASRILSEIWPKKEKATINYFCVAHPSGSTRLMRTLNGKPIHGTTIDHPSTQRCR